MNYITLDKEIKRIMDIDEEIFEAFKDSTQYIIALKTKSTIPKTSELFWMYIISSNFIKEAIFECSIKDNIYSASILFRSLIEHYLRFNYMYFKYSLSKEDSVSEHYLTVLQISEYVSKAKSINNAISVSNFKKYDKKIIWDEIREKFPSLNKKENDVLEQYLREFDIKKIIAFINNLLKNNDSDILETKFLTDTILEYSELSSFVHGGIYAFQRSIDFGNKSKREKEFIRISSVSLQIASSIKLFSYLIFLNFHEGFKNIYLQTEPLIKKI